MKGINRLLFPAGLFLILSLLSALTAGAASPQARAVEAADRGFVPDAAPAAVPAAQMPRNTPSEVPPAVANREVNPFAEFVEQPAATPKAPVQEANPFAEFAPSATPAPVPAAQRPRNTFDPNKPFKVIDDGAPPEPVLSAASKFSQNDVILILIVIGVLGCWRGIFMTLRSGKVLEIGKIAFGIVLAAAVLCLTFPFPVTEHSTYYPLRHLAYPVFFAAAGARSIDWIGTIHGFLWLSSIFIALAWAFRSSVAYCGDQRKTAKSGVVDSVGAVFNWIVAFMIATAFLAIAMGVLIVWSRRN